MQGSLGAALPLNGWEHITPGPMFLMSGNFPDTAIYLEMEAKCAREAENGLFMVWRDGRELCKVEPFDGHPTNADTYDNPEPNGVDCQGVNERFTIRD